MGERGPLPKPPHLRVLSTAGRKPDRVEVQPADFGDTTPPDCLGELGRKVWEEIVATNKLLTCADRESLLDHCIQHENRARYLAIIQAEGEFYTIGSNGAKAAHPACARLDKANMAIERFRQRFGMTPSSRCGLHIKPTSKTSGLPSRDRHATYTPPPPKQDIA